MLYFLLACGSDKSNDTASSSLATLPDEATELLQGPLVDCANPSARLQNPMQEQSLGAAWSAQDPAGWDVIDGLWIGGEGVAVADWTGDGRLDIYIPTIDKNLLFVQNADGSFSDETDLRLPDAEQGYSIGASTADADGDGDLDLFVLNDFLGHQLFINIDGYLSEQTTVSGFDFYTDAYYPGSSWGDADGDGDLELFVAATGGGPLGPPPFSSEDDFEYAEANSYWLNNGNGTFTRQNLPDTDPEPYSCCAAWLDIDGDHLQDLYVVNDFGAFVTPNQLYLGSTSGALTSVDVPNLTIPAFGMGLAVGDLNHDGTPDWIVTDWGRNHLLESDGAGGWYDSTFSRNLIAQQSDQYVAWGAEFVDVNNDGLLDAWVGYGQLDIPEEAQGDFDNLGLYNPRFQPDALYIQEPNGTFTDVAADWGINRETISRGGVWADLNRDGFMDFISPAIDGPAVAYVATCDDSTWLNVQPRQADGNRFAIGARIEVIANDTETPQSRWILAGGTSASSGAPPEAHFGLGSAQQATVRVYWPDGEISEHADVPTRQHLQITRQFGY